MAREKGGKVQRRISNPALIIAVLCLIVLSELGSTVGKLVKVDEQPYIYKLENDGDNTLKLVLLTHRHGDRAPIFYPDEELDFVPWPLGYGQLTSTGIHQLYQLGSQLREKYITSQTFLPESYTADIIKVRASDVDRTLQSAFSLLTGLYPPGTGPRYPFEYPYDLQNPSLPESIQPIPIHTVDRSTDYLILSYDNCKKYQKYLKDDVFSSPYALKVQADHQPLLDQLATTFDMPVTLANLNMPYDVLFCEHAHGYWGVRGIDNDTYNAVEELENYVFSNFEFKPSDYSYLIASPLIGDFISNIDARINQSSSTLFYHYSDVTVAALLSGLEYQLAEVPPYHANVIIELHMIEGDYYLKFFYNFEPFSVPGCSSDSDPFLCPYSSFKSKYEGTVPADPAAACAVEEVVTDDGDNYQNNDNNDDNNDNQNNDGVGNERTDPYWIFILFVMIAAVLIVLIAIAFGYLGYRRYQIRRSSSSRSSDDLPPPIEMSVIESKETHSKSFDD